MNKSPNFVENREVDEASVEEDVFITNKLQGTASTSDPEVVVSVWSKPMVTKMLDLYADLASMVGPSNKFKLKKDMWTNIAEQINNEFSTSFTFAQVDSRYRNWLGANKKIAKNNRKRKINQPDQIEKILSPDKSIKNSESAVKTQTPGPSSSFTTSLKTSTTIDRPKRSKRQRLNLPPSFSDLPLHIIEHVFDYLPMNDLLNATVTCKQWFTALKHPRFRKRIKLSIGYVFSMRQTTLPTDLILDSTRIYENVCLENITLKNYDRQFFKKLGMHIKHFSFTDTILHYNYFIKVLDCLPALEELEVDSEEPHGDFFNFDLDKVPVGLQNLKSFGTTYYSEQMLSRITRIIPNLEKFTLQEDSSAQFVRNDCLNFLNKYRRTLKSLDITDRFWNTLFENGPVTIDELDLNELRIESFKTVPAVQFILSQKNLTKLEVSFQLTFEQIKMICDNLHKLEVIRFSSDRLPCESIRNLKNLKELKLTSENVNIVDAISVSRIETLQVLHLSRTNITKTLSPLFVNLHKLQELKIWIDKEMNIDIFQLIFKHMINLEILFINWAGNHKLQITTSTNDTEYYDIGRLIKLKSLRFIFPADKIPGFSLEHLMKLKNLTCLWFYQNKSIKKTDQKRLMQSLPLLENIDFSDWEGIDQKIIFLNGPRLNRHSVNNCLTALCEDM